MNDNLQEAANRLASEMRQYSWYHRASHVWTPGGSYLVVWGEGDRPQEVPREFSGYRVTWNRVSKKHPCPFGSVKP